MKNRTTLLLALVLTFFAGAANSESVTHAFSTTDIVFVDPLLDGLTSVSGSFEYDNGVNAFGTTGAASGAPGSTIYRALSGLSANANGNRFSDSLGSVIIGDEKFPTCASPCFAPVDNFTLGWEGLGDGTLSGFTFAGMPLTDVRFNWREGRNGTGDFLEDQSLPAVLPPAVSGILVLVFRDAADVQHFAIFGVTIAPILPAGSDINFSGRLGIVDKDIGGRVYSGVPIGTVFSGALSRFTSTGFISDGTTITAVDCCIEVGGRGLVVENDADLEEPDVVLLADLGFPGFVAGDLVDLILVEGDTVTPGGDRLEVLLAYVLDPLAFDNDSRDNYPPDPDDVLVTLFGIFEEANRGLTVSFDTWDNLGADAIGIDVLVDGEVIARDFTNPYTDGNFVPVSVVFDADGTLDLTFDGNSIFVDLPTGFSPVGFDRFGFGGRTGAGFEVNRIDNVSISVCGDPAGCASPDGAYVNDFSAGVGSASLLGDAVVDSGSLRLTDSVVNQIGSLVIDDLVPGGVVASFSGTFDLQTGPGSDPPADGISFYFGPLPDEAFGEDGSDENQVYAAFGTVDSDDGIDSDLDGIEDEIDGTFDGAFNDQSSVASIGFTDQHLGGDTFGFLVDRSDNLLAVTDVPVLGALLRAAGGAGTSEIVMCGQTDADSFSIFLNDGDQIAATCGSFTGDVLAGTVTVTIGTNIEVTMPTGAKAFMELLSGSLISITNLSDADGPDIAIADDGIVTYLEPGDSPLVTNLETTPQRCDVDADGDVDRLDISSIMAARSQPASGADDPRDADGDGMITILDGRTCMLQCDLPRCAILP